MPVRFLLSTPLFVGLLYATLSCATAAEKPQAPAFKHEPGTTKGVVDLDNFTKPKTATTLVSKKGYDLVPNTKEPSNWKFEDGVLTASHVWDGLLTKKPYTDFLMYVEFNCNKGTNPNPEKK